MQGATWTSSNEGLVLARELGERVRSYRVDSGVEISELAARTRIGQQYLKALEAGKLDKLPGPVFVKGFIRSVCSELGRDPFPLIELVDQIHLDELPEEIDGSNGSRRTIPLVLSVIALAGLITGGILLHGGGDKDDEITKLASSNSSAMQQNTIGSVSDAVQAEEKITELDLLLRATEKTWIRIHADSSDPWETTMKTGDEIRLKAMDRVSLFIGNAGGLLFELNGKRFGPLGTRGEVISNYVITKDNL